MMGTFIRRNVLQRLVYEQLVCKQLRIKLRVKHSTQNYILCLMSFVKATQIHARAKVFLLQINIFNRDQLPVHKEKVHFCFLFHSFLGVETMYVTKMKTWQLRQLKQVLRLQSLITNSICHKLNDRKWVLSPYLENYQCLLLNIKMMFDSATQIISLHFPFLLDKAWPYPDLLLPVFSSLQLLLRLIGGLGTSATY